MVRLILSRSATRPAKALGLTVRLLRPGALPGSPEPWGFAGCFPLLTLSTSSMPTSGTSSRRERYARVACACPLLYLPSGPASLPNGPWRRLLPQKATRSVRESGARPSGAALDKGADPPSGGCCPPTPSASGRAVLSVAPLPLTGFFLWLVEEAVLGSPDGGLGAGGQVQLAQDVGDVMLDRLVRQEEVGRNLLVGLPMGGQPEDPLLLLRQ